MHEAWVGRKAGAKALRWCRRDGLSVVRALCVHCAIGKRLMPWRGAAALVVSADWPDAPTTLPCSDKAGPLTVAMHELAGMFELDMPLCGHSGDSVHRAVPACCCTCAFGSRAAFEPRLLRCNQNSGNPVSMP
ncbi:hypothetical protein [Xanthomonas arboricola]|uniref:hypothetical protein n=1 Tax=Xanthomonas arboricola TaxID=56448 RepID=UPI001AFB2EF1|nr:hypothetical protein [Xanthomonas arboricola]CAD7378867.1 hypothetical protein X12_001362 [Xanthomonas arboricola]CAG2087146.1 hypothetical protein XCY_001361 [Xanthomonas arboricola pv. juglandis]